MIVFEDLGIPLTHQKITPGDTLSSVSSYCYKYVRFRLNIDDADSEIVVGDWVVGASSGAVGCVVSLSVSAWTNGTGYLILDSWNGIAFQDDEELKVAAGATMANVNGVLITLEGTDYIFKGMEAKAALVVGFGNTALVSMTKGRPDQTAKIGTPLAAGSSLVLRNVEAIRNFKVIDYTSGQASTVQIDFCF